MKTPGFIEGALLALAASILTSLAYSLFSSSLPSETLLRLLVTGMTLGYILYLLKRSHRRIGKISSLLFYLVASGVCWLLDPPLVIFLLLHGALIWALRSLYFQHTLLGAMADLALVGVGVAGMLLALLQTSSLFIAVWCFFLVQALYGLLPSASQPLSKRPPETRQQRFSAALQRAECALKTLHRNP